MTLPAPASTTPEGAGTGFAAATYLDLVRAAAANWVVIAHLLLLFQLKWWPYQGGGAAVVVFFLLSGFLISQSMARRMGQPGPHFASFLTDRLARIMTPYVPALVCVTIADAVWLDTRFGGSGLLQGPLAFIGNLLMLQDFPVFQLMELSGQSSAWRIRPYNSAEPFWTVAIEMWIYVSVGLLFFWLVMGERLRRRWLIPLLLLSVPVLIWNAAAGAGRSLSLIWLVGALAGVVLTRLSESLTKARCRWLAVCMLFAGLVTMGGHIRKFGFNPYELQMACLLALVLFAPVLYLKTSTWAPRPLMVLANAAASYSYSLYLIHNTAIALVWTLVGGVATSSALCASVVLAHVAGVVLYLGSERHHRRVGAWLRPRLVASMYARNAPVAGGSGTALPAGQVAMATRDLNK